MRMGEGECRWHRIRDQVTRKILVLAGGGRCKERSWYAYLHSLSGSLHLPFNRGITTINFENRILSRPIILSPPIWTGSTDKLIFIDITVIIGPGRSSSLLRFLSPSNPTRIIGINACSFSFFFFLPLSSLQTRRSRYNFNDISYDLAVFEPEGKFNIYSSILRKENYSKYAAKEGKRVWRYQNVRKFSLFPSISCSSEIYIYIYRVLRPTVIYSTFQFAIVVPLAYRFFVLLIITGYRVISVNGVRLVNISRFVNQQWRNDLFFLSFFLLASRSIRLIN